MIINGPNLNLLGKREIDIYGDRSFDQFLADLRAKHPDCKIDYFQSNSEGELIDQIHKVGFSIDGIVFNGGGYTHTSIAIRDAFAGISAPMIEVHISNIHAREEYRKHSYTAEVATGLISGLGLRGYDLAIQYFKLRP